VESKGWILLLDDEFDIANVFKNVLAKRGHSVFAFTDPLIALEHYAMNSKNYALVVSDVRMPIMNGFEFAAKVRAINSRVKLILMSAFEISDVEYSAAINSIKIDGFLRKPIEIANFTRRVEATLAA
jgi:two-component SAPR family response regulator